MLLFFLRTDRIQGKGVAYMYKICHTEESASRQRAIEQGLLSILQTQPYAKITLTELCRQLNIPRKSFYRYFPTKDDCLLALIDHTLSDCNDIALKGWTVTGKLDAAVQLRFFTFWKEHRNLLNVIRDNDLRYLLLERTSVMVDRIKENTGDNGFARNQVEYFIAHGLMTTVLRWHHHGFPGSPEEMAEVFGRLLSCADVSLDRLLL